MCNPGTQLEVKRSKVEVNRPIKDGTKCVQYLMSLTVTAVANSGGMGITGSL